MNLLEHFVGGKLISGSSDRKSKIFNPATGEQESEVRLASKADLDQAVEVAQKAFETWSLKPALQRARVMFKFKELIEKNACNSLITALNTIIHEFIRTFCWRKADFRLIR